MSCCPICLDDDPDLSEFIAPCLCQTYVHRTCLDTWRTTALVPDAMTRCPTCKYYYEFEEPGELDVKRKCEREMRFEVAKRIVYVFITVFFGSLAMFIFDTKENGLILGFFPSSWPNVIVYILTGTFITIFIAGLFKILTIIFYYFYYNCYNNRVHDESDFREAHRHQYKCTGCSESRSSGGCNQCIYIGDCGGGGDCKEIVLILIAIATVVILFVGVFVLIYFVIGGFATGIDNHFQTTYNKIESKYRKVKNLRPLSNLIVI